MKNKLIVILLTSVLVLLVPFALFGNSQSANNEAVLITETTSYTTATSHATASVNGQMVDIYSSNGLNEDFLQGVEVAPVQIVSNQVKILYADSYSSVAVMPGKQVLNSNNMILDVRNESGNSLSQIPRYAIGFDSINQFVFTNNSRQYDNGQYISCMAKNDAERLNTYQTNG